MTTSSDALFATDCLRTALGLDDDQTPFPWQEELLNRFRSEVIPPALDIPTGLGKTAVIAIWLVARSEGAKLPRRLVYVVDRRAVVDQATTEAERLRDWVEMDANVKQALGLTSPLPISTLRGQHVDNRQWLEDPASPAIIVGTVDMVGSRLLFEGYGVSRKMRPYHAGLLGSDTLIVLDEAHLVPPFEKLLESIASGVGEFGPTPIDGATPVPPFHLMSLSATGRGSGNNTHALTDKDLVHPVVKKRLGATKRVVLRPLMESQDSAPGGHGAEGEGGQGSALVAALAREAWPLGASGENSRVVVFCDSREVAGKVKSAVEKLAARDEIEIEAELFVGGRRVFEREQARKRLEVLGFLAGSNALRSKPTFLFATSAAEVGVDLDADHMVSDLVAWERMVQRLGRVNRRGEGEATVVVIVESPKPKKKEVGAIAKQSRGEALDDKERKIVEGFEARSRQVQLYQEPFNRLPEDDRGFDASPGALRKLKQDAEGDPAVRKVLDDATTAAPLRPALTRALVDAWSLTSLEKHTGRPAIDPWLRGWIENDPPQTSIVWRAHLPIRSGGTLPSKKEVEAFFEAAPPHASEILETETFRLFEWLSERGKSVRARSENGEEGLPSRSDIVAFVLARDGQRQRAFRLDDLKVDKDKDAEKKRKDMLESGLAGATLVVDARLAGLKDGLLEPAASTPPRTADDGQDWLGDGVVRFRLRSAEADAAVVSDPVWRERLRFAAEVSDEGEARRWLIVDKWRHDAATEEDRSAARLQLLDEHQSWAEARARAVAKRLGLEAAYEEMLAVAAVLHDEGKRAKRWQRSFNAPEGGPYAKTKGPINYALLDGYRHELGSLPRAQTDERVKGLPDELRDLALHLITAHHGFGRPVIGTSGCEDAPPSVVEERAREVALRFARLQRRWGPWGLAWWEALLRAADQQASRDNDTVESATESKAA
jgi:CRISPR-associated endonuclease/helicase Cas3